jgi:ketosteroid isomerase-like protein
MRFRNVSLILVLGIVLTLSLTACGGSSSETSAATQALQKQSDLYAIDGIEKTWHKASSTHNVDLMMSIWAPDSTFTIGPTTLTGKAQIRDFFAQKAAPFQAANHWVSDTPAYKIRITVNGDRGTLYFECHYIDVKTQKVMSVVAADQNVQRINGKWLITNASGASPTLSP